MIDKTHSRCLMTNSTVASRKQQRKRTRRRRLAGKLACSDMLQINVDRERPANHLPSVERACTRTLSHCSFLRLPCNLAGQDASACLAGGPGHPQLLLRSEMTAWPWLGSLLASVNCKCQVVAGSEHQRAVQMLSREQQLADGWDRQDLRTIFKAMVEACSRANGCDEDRATHHTSLSWTCLKRGSMLHRPNGPSFAPMHFVCTAAKLHLLGQGRQDVGIEADLRVVA